MFKKMVFVLGIGAFAFSGMVSGMAFAQAKVISEHNDWTLSKDGVECWAMSPPISEKITQNGKVVKANRDPAVLFLAYNKEKGVFGEIAYKSGFPMKKGEYLTLAIDGDSFQMLSDNEWAWSINPDNDDDIIEAMKDGNRAVIKSQSSRGKTITDTFSLSGFTAAAEGVKKNCE